MDAKQRRRYYDMLKAMPSDELKTLWEEITEKEYWYKLEIVVPERHHHPTFLVGEATVSGIAGTIHNAYTIVNGRYFKRPAPLEEYNPANYTAEIRAKFKLYEHTPK